MHRLGSYLDGRVHYTYKEREMANVKLETVIAQDAAGYAADIQEAVKKATADTSVSLQDLINGINERRVKVATDKVEKEKVAVEEASKANQGKIDGLRTNIEATMVKPWMDGKLSEQLEAIPVGVVKHLTIRIDRDTDTGKAIKPVVLFGEPIKARVVRSGNGGPKAQSMTVNGKEYKSASAAKRALLPDKADASMNRLAIESMLRTAGHTIG